MSGIVMAGVGPKNGCNCRTCWNAWRKSPENGNKFASAFIVCSTCGNKRCPHATDHSLECTGSNEPGQAGSVYA